MTDDIKDLEAVVEECRVRLRDAETALRTAKKKAAPFQPGDVVEVRLHRSGWTPAIVRVVETDWSVYYRVGVKKKNGEWGKATRLVGRAEIRAVGEAKP